MDDYELHWAAGFFDGEGSIYFAISTGQLGLSLSQVRREPLDRFVTALATDVKITQRKAYKRSSAAFQVIYTNDRALHVATTLTPLLCAPKREQIERTLARWDAHKDIVAELKAEHGRHWRQHLGLRDYL